MPLPLTTAARDLATTLLAEPLPQRHAHVTGVATRMTELLQQPAAHALTDRDRDELIAAAWLHDIGYSPTLVDTGMHAIDGARYLQTAPEAAALAHLAPLVEHHSNARYEATARGLTLTSDTPDPLHRSLLWGAAVTTAPTGAPIHWPDRLADIRDRYPDGPVRAAIDNCLPEFDLAQALVTQAPAPAAPHHAAAHA